MTESEELIKKISDLEKALRQTKAESREYLQNVAHQLTAPLGAIKWSIEALKDDQIPIGRKQNLLRSVYSQATILVHLIKNFSLMSNLEADRELGEFRESPEKIDPLRLAINLANDFQPQAFEQRKKISVDEASFKKIIGSKKLLVTKNLIAQAVSNLLENAVKYSDINSEIYIKAESVKGCGISVHSTGLPIAEEEKSRLVERNYRGGAAKQKVAAGTGIGLYLANRIMILHKGSLRIETSGRNSKFIIIFPPDRIVL